MCVCVVGGGGAEDAGKQIFDVGGTVEQANFARASIVSG